MPACEGTGQVSDIDLSQLVDETKSLAEGAITIPGYTQDGWMVDLQDCGSSTPTSRSRTSPRSELRRLPLQGASKIKLEGINITYEGLIPKIQKSMLTKDVEAMQPHIRAFVERAVAFAACPECDGTRLAEGARKSKIAGINIADPCAMQISDLAEWVRNAE